MTFSLDHINTAHAKVKSGADFPVYIQDLIELGVRRYEIFVSDGHSVFYDAYESIIQTSSKYTELLIAQSSNKDQFVLDLKNHQNGKTDYPTFCYDYATSGIEKWTFDLSKMTCTYLDCNEEEILIEAIPTV